MTAVILSRVVLSVAASAIQKRLLLDGADSRKLWIATYALMLLPSVAIAFATWQTAAPGFWTAAILAGILDALGNLAMLAALRSADLSVFGPLNAIRPLLALLFGWLFLSELPTATGVVGVAITVFGAWLLLRDENTPSTSPQTRKVVLILAFRSLGFILSTIAAVFLKRSAHLASAEATLALWTTSGLICLIVYHLLHREPTAPAANNHRVWLILHAAAFLLMQWLTIRIFQTTLLTYSFALFQLGMVLQVIVGRWLFREANFGRRLSACAIMTVGSLLILWKG